jgi:tRNA/rRNA methyltransferase
MASIEVAVMAPKYQINLGYIARAAKNFGVSKIAIINPRCRHTGKQAIRYSKHAADLLKGATILKSIEELGADLLIGTTGTWHKSGASYYNIYSPKQISGLARRAESAKGKTVILLGRDDTGLEKQEIAACDAVVFIGTNPNYPILNISHALAIILYELTFAEMGTNYAIGSFYADPSYQGRLLMLFDSIVRGRPNIKNKAAVSAAFRRIIRRSVPTKKEINAISGALSLNRQTNTEDGKPILKARFARKH